MQNSKVCALIVHLAVGEVHALMPKRWLQKQQVLIIHIYSTKEIFAAYTFLNLRLKNSNL